jgi:hypothetical protein
MHFEERVERGLDSRFRLKLLKKFRDMGVGLCPMDNRPKRDEAIDVHIVFDEIVLDYLRKYLLGGWFLESGPAPTGQGAAVGQPDPPDSEPALILEVEHLVED